MISGNTDSFLLLLLGLVLAMISSNGSEHCYVMEVAMCNGQSTGYFNLERGARQDDPLSPNIFMLCFEVLLIQIRND